MHQGRTTLSKFLIQQLKGAPEQSDLAALLVDIAAAVKAISAMTAKGELGGVLGSLDSTNVQGETQKKLDVMSNQAFINTFSMGGLVAGLASEENDDPVEIDSRDGGGRFLALFDPLDGSSNIDVNVSAVLYFRCCVRLKVVHRSSLTICVPVIISSLQAMRSMVPPRCLC